MSSTLALATELQYDFDNFIYGQDFLSYRSVNVPAQRIFTIDSSGEVKLSLLPGYKSSYTKLTDLVDQIFRMALLQIADMIAPLKSTKANVEYNDFQFWKNPIADVIIDVIVSTSSESDADDEYDGYEDQLFKILFCYFLLIQITYFFTLQCNPLPT